VPGKEVELDKELVLKDLEHLLQVGHGELVIKVTDHKIADIQCNHHRRNKGDR